MGSHRAAQFSHANTLPCLCEAFFGASEFVEHERELQTKRDRLGMNAVAASDHGRLFIFARLFANDFSQCPQIIRKNFGRLRHLNRERGIENIGGC